jgi:hypothetical protein
MRHDVEIDRKVRAALKRLQSKNPDHPDLKERARTGRRLINVSTVALEASISRTLIGHDGCPYPQLRQDILKAASEERPALPPTQLVADLRAEIRSLKEQIEMKDTYIAELLLELQRLGGSTDTVNGSVIDFRRERLDRRRK